MWVLTAFQGSLSRLDGSTWKRYAGPDFGTETNYMFCGFVVDGEEVWGATTDGVVHFDGRSWRCWRNVPVSQDASSVVAGGGHVWVIDKHGNLSHYAGSAWSTSRLVLPGVQWNKKYSIARPKLARTANGWLWRVFDGAWRFDGTSWATVTCPGECS